MSMDDNEKIGADSDGGSFEEGCEWSRAKGGAEVGRTKYAHDDRNEKRRAQEDRNEVQQVWRWLLDWQNTAGRTRWRDGERGRSGSRWRVADHQRQWALVAGRSHLTRERSGLRTERDGKKGEYKTEDTGVDA